jgi:hypothetical protein
MKIKYIILLFIIYFLNSCNTKNYEDKFNEAKKREVNSELFFEQDSLIFIGNTHRFCVEDSFVILLDKYSDKNFTLINVNTKKAYRICSVGQGPGELINPSVAISPHSHPLLPEKVEAKSQ